MGPGPRGHMMRGFSGLPRGFAKLVVLEALKDGPSHGYELSKKIAERYGGWYFPSSGLIYPTLSLLEDMGYASIISREGKRVYQITDEGRKYLESHRNELEAFGKKRMFVNHSAKMLGLRSELVQIGIAIRQLGVLSSEEKLEQTKKILEEARRKIEQLGA